MTMTRIARPERLAALLLFAGIFWLSGGCKKPSAKLKPSGGPDSGPVTLSLSGGSPAPRGGDEFARFFLKAVNDGTATPGQLSPAFKKLIAPPVFAADEAQGYSDTGAASWLAQFKGKLPDATATLASGSTTDAPGFFGNASGDTRSSFALRLVPAGGSWQADWLVVIPTTIAGQDVNRTGGSAGFAAVAFLEALIAKDDLLTAGLMSQGLKARLAPPFDSDKARGYNRGILSSKLGDLRGTATGFAIDRYDGNAVFGALTTGGAKKPVTLKFVKGERPWDWLLDDIEVK